MEPGTAICRTCAHVIALPAILAAALFVAAPPAAAAISDPDLAPYRDLARSPAAARILAFARAAMESHWIATPASDDSLPDWPGAPPRELYVSLVGGSATRACIGRPPAGPLAACVRALAIQVLSADPRHPPVRRDELDRLRLVIAFAGEDEEVADPLSVDPAREGLRLAAGGRSIAFLPGEARTVAWALRTARRAGVLPAGAAVTCSHFSVIVISEPLRPRTYEGGPSHADE
ncbi:MAG TPA: AMMECR1 domain-containing protein [Terriglobales bacterium]|nr:AMMECR1 domain-containing protein [Terriglobales bacterium]